MRDIFEISRGYEDPPRFLNFYTWRDSDGKWRRSRAITLAVTMRAGAQVGRFGEAIDNELTKLKQRLPDDLILARVSDQPQQVRESMGLFMRCLFEAVVLVILVALVGFRQWRPAVLVGASIPITLAMTFGMMQMLGLDLQQVSITTLIVVLGLLVDDPVVAGAAIRNELANGHEPGVASWLGPTKLSRVILYTTITNIAAYLPLLLVSGSVGRYIYTLPMVITCSLVASRIVSMTFIPLLSYYLLRQGKKPERTLAERRERGLSGFYYRAASLAIRRRWVTLLASLVFLAAGGLLATRLKLSFFPKDLSYLSYLDVWLPEDAPLATTNEAAQRAEAVVREGAEADDRARQENGGRHREILESLTTFIGGGGPRFWFSVAPEQQQLNYAQIVIRVKDKYDTERLVPILQQELSARVPGARIDVRQLETGKPVGMPVSIRISGEEIPTLRTLAEGVKDIFRAIPMAERVRDDWGTERFVVDLKVNSDVANLSGISNLDVAASSIAAVSGLPVTALREGNEQIPVIARLRPEELAQLSDIHSLYVYSLQGTAKLPLQQASTGGYHMETEKIRRRNQFRTITVSCMPSPGTLPTDVLKAMRAKLTEFERTLPRGYRLEIGGEEEERSRRFEELGIVMMVSVITIFLALVIQFKHAAKPLLIFSAIPYGMAGAIAGLVLMGAPFGFMAFLGIASLIGVIVSHVIVLFDYIEGRREQGAPIEQALLDAGIARLQPVMITVGATIFGLIPLAIHGGPFWESMCYAQIGGLAIANYITKLLAPALYAIFALDLKLIEWK